MLRYSSRTSKIIVKSKIYFRGLGTTKILECHERDKNPESDFKEKRERKPSSQRKYVWRNPKYKIEAQKGKDAVDFESRWLNLMENKLVKPDLNPKNRLRVENNNDFKALNNNSLHDQNQKEKTPFKISLEKNHVKTWKDRLEEKSKHHKSNHTQDPLTLFLEKRDKQHIKRKPELRKGRKQNKYVPSITDMKDVSVLRAAFLKSIKRQKNAMKRQPEEKPEWRRSGGAKEYRDRLKEGKWKNKETSKRLKPIQGRVENTITEDASNFFFGAKDEMEEAAMKRNQEAILKHRRVQDDLRVTLPSSPVTVLVLSSIFREKVDNILQLLRQIGFRSMSLKKIDEKTIIDLDTMELLAMELGLEAMRSVDESNHQLVFDETQHLLLKNRKCITEVDEMKSMKHDHDVLKSRPPIVCIMGHVDHGKTTLMDSLRRKSQNLRSSGKKRKSKKKNGGKNENEFSVAGTEAGGITQAISAFQVSLQKNASQAVTFLDTPGHAAFRAMRESGSHAADVICLVIAADDGVLAQTVEILDFYKSIVSAAGTTISLVVAMTKVDKPSINIEKSQYQIETQLMEHGILSESFAGTSTFETSYGFPVQVVPVSGLTGYGIEDLIESLTLQSEIMELRASSSDFAEGVIMDARLEKGIGVVVDCIVRWGSLQRGDIVLSGVHCGKVKALKDVNNATLQKVIPSQPVQILGFKSLPKAGDPIVSVSSLEEAEEIIQRRLASIGDNSFRTKIDIPTELEVTGVAAQQNAMLSHIHAKYNLEANVDANYDTIRIPVVIKADADATLSALRGELMTIGTKIENLGINSVIIDIISEDVGPVNENDIQMALESNAPILCFNIKTEEHLPNSEDVILISSNVIYSLLESTKKVFSERFLPKTRVEKVHGRARVQAIFKINDTADKIAGLRVIQGSLYREKSEKDSTKCWYRVLRTDKVISPGILASSLKCEKKHVQSVRKGDECGLELKNYTDFKEGDIVECFSVEEQYTVLK